MGPIDRSIDRVPSGSIARNETNTEIQSAHIHHHRLVVEIIDLTKNNKSTMVKFSSQVASAVVFAGLLHNGVDGFAGLKSKVRSSALKMVSRTSEKRKLPRRCLLAWLPGGGTRDSTRISASPDSMKSKDSFRIY